MSTFSATFFLVLRNSGRTFPKLAAKLGVRRPTRLAAGEVVVELKIAVPSALFSRPTLRATVEVPAGQVPPVITAEVQDNIARTLSEQLGIVVHVEAKP